jgi:hypothetical protein
VAALTAERDEARGEWMRAQAGLDTVRAQLEYVIEERDTLRALVREAGPHMGGALEYANPGDVARLKGWLNRAAALLGDWHDSLDAAVPGTGTMLRNQEDGAE